MEEYISGRHHPTSRHRQASPTHTLTHWSPVLSVTHRKSLAACPRPVKTKRSKVKPFIKVINYNHLMPTRYTLELEGLKGVITADTFKEVSQREDAKKTVKKALEERYTSGKNRWFFTPLSTSHYIGFYWFHIGH